MEKDSSATNTTGVQVSLFDYSVENYLKAIDKISELCDEPETNCLDESDTQRFSSSITFLREWRYFNYESRSVRFANETGAGGKKVVLSEINLPQFSSAAVPKNEGSCADVTSLESCGFNCCKDFVMYAGGSVWALDWCPRVHERSDCHTKCEFIAVAAHPPGSYYHQLGPPLTGRGIVQIWCILNASLNEEEASPPKKTPKKQHKVDDAIEDELKKPRGRPRKNPTNESLDSEAERDKSIKFKRPRGRPRKKLRGEPSDNSDINGPCAQPLTVQYSNDSSDLQYIQEFDRNMQEHNVQKIIDKRKKHSTERESSTLSSLENLVKSRRLKSKGNGGKNNDDICQPSCASEGSGQDSLQCNNVSGSDSLDIRLSSCSTRKNISLPRVILCLAHNGKVAWDVKWQPNNVKSSKCQQRMGYLAVLLGNGSLEVWEVPLPCTIKAIYLSSVNEGTDPRFVKLKPVFRCSILKCGGIQSIPLTVEWSTSQPHDYLLAGCHDGSVALWKFSARSSSEDTRPLLCFSADTVPIRTVGWAPTESDQESANVIVTAGHGGLKFWDIRDPFHPLWDLHSVPRFIYSLDWSKDPSCVVLSFDDGGLRILSLVKNAYDVPATGKPFAGTKHGLHLSNCLPFAVWSVQVSRQTGMVAYCSADGTVIRFKLTAKAAEKDSAHNRAPHFMCGYLTEDESSITVNTPIPDVPITTLKKPANDCGERTMRGLATDLNAVKRANDKKRTGSNSDNQTLAICYDNGQAGESDDDITLEALKNKKEFKSTSNRRKNVKDDQAMVCLDEEARNIQGSEMEKLETVDDVEVMPLKMVAVHRVRWNMNKGSERWLCYGGAAGIIRCQEIIDPLPNKPRKRT